MYGMTMNILFVYLGITLAIVALWYFVFALSIEAAEVCTTEK